MAFAIFYNTADLTYIGGSITAADYKGAVSQADKNLARRYWNGGLNAWATSPAYIPPEPDPGMSDARIVVISYGTKQEFIDLCLRIADQIALDEGHGDTRYLIAWAKDLALTAIEPWPPA